MCEEQQILMLEELSTIAKLLKPRKDIDELVAISGTRFYPLDYQDRYYVYAFSPTPQTLSVEDLGAISLPAFQWTNISMQPGARLFAVGQTNTVPIYLRHTDHFIDRSISSYQYTHITTSTSTIVSPVGGYLHSIVVNNPGTSWAFSIIDSGTAGAVTPTAAVAVPSAVGVLTYDITLNSGLIVTTVGATPGDLTVVWR